MCVSPVRDMVCVWAVNWFRMGAVLNVTRMVQSRRVPFTPCDYGNQGGGEGVCPTVASEMLPDKDKPLPASCPPRPNLNPRLEEERQAGRQAGFTCGTVQLADNWEGKELSDPFLPSFLLHS